MKSAAELISTAVKQADGYRGRSGDTSHPVEHAGGAANSALADYMDYTGTGNSLNVRHPHSLQLIMDSLRSRASVDAKSKRKPSTCISVTQ